MFFRFYAYLARHKKRNDMKSFRTLFRSAAAMLLLCAASLAACDDSDGDPKFGDSITLEITVDEVTDSSIQATVTPSSPDAGYYAKLYSQHEVADKNDNTLLAMCMSDRLFTSYLHQGKQTLTFENLRPGIAYVLVAFGYEDEQSTGVTSKLVRETIALPAKQ